MKYEYRTSGTCSKLIQIEVDEGKIVSVTFIGGCSGNTQGISKLVEGADIEYVAQRLDGIKCGVKPTSCPDQLSRALKMIIAKNSK